MGWLPAYGAADIQLFFSDASDEAAPPTEVTNFDYSDQRGGEVTL